MYIKTEIEKGNFDFNRAEFRHRRRLSVSKKTAF